MTARLASTTDAAALAEEAGQVAPYGLHQGRSVETGPLGERRDPQEDAHERDALHSDLEIRPGRVLHGERRRVEGEEADLPGQRSPLA